MFHRSGFADHRPPGSYAVVVEEDQEPEGKTKKKVATPKKEKSSPTKEAENEEISE